MPPAQKQIAIRSIHVAKMGLQLSLGASAYRENLRYGGCGVYRFFFLVLDVKTFVVHSCALYPRYRDVWGVSFASSC